jgi:multidrug efflux pump subunit AcrA (membrane-fusion protein)
MASVNPQSVEETKQQIRGLIQEIQQLARSSMTPEEFYEGFLNRVVAALAAVGGAVWMLNEDRRPKLSYQIRVPRELHDEDTEEAAKHLKLLEALARANEARLIPPMSSASDPALGGNPTQQLLVVAPLGHDGQVEGLVEVFQRPDTAPATQRGYQRFLVQMCEMAAEWFKNRKLQHLGERHSLWAQADQFSRTVHESLDLRETCYNVVNEGRRLLGVDRVSVAIQRGRNCVVEAISGQDTLDQRSNVVANLGRIVTRVVASGEPLWYQGTTDDMPPQIEQALEAYVDDSFTRSMAILPLRRPRGDSAPSHNPTGEGAQANGEIIGALIIEQIESDIPREVLNPRLELVYEHSGRAITNALDHTSLFLMPVWRTLGKAAWVVRARTLPKTLTIAGIIAALLVALIVVPWEFDMKAKGEVQPVLKRDVFSNVEGEIYDVLKDNGDKVAAGEVVCRMRNFDLERQLIDVRGRYLATSAQLESVRTTLNDRSRKMSETETVEMAGRQLQLEAQKKSLDLEVQSLERKKENLDVKSPIDGVVISWDVRKQLENRPVQTGQVLMTVANDTQGWEVDVFMRQSRIGHVNKARQSISPNLPVEYILLSDPGVTRKGTVLSVDETSQQHEQEGHVVRIRVDTKEQLVGVRAGTTVKADINCGTRSVGYVLFHEAWEWLQTNVFFW